MEAAKADLETCREAKKRAEAELEKSLLGPARVPAGERKGEGEGEGRAESPLPLTLMKMYDQQADAEDALRNKRVENRWLKLYLEKMRVEIKAKTPAI